MRTILVPVDGSACSDKAVREVIKTYQQTGKIAVHLLNVQARIFPESAMVYLEPSKIDTYYYEQGSKDLASAEKLLKSAGVDYTAHRATGPIAETVVQKAGELRADGIVMGTHGHSRIAGLLLGSVSNKVLHLSPIPVTLVGTETRFDVAGRLGAT